MPISFILALICVGAAAVGAVVAVLAAADDVRGGGIIAVVLGVLGGIIFTITASANTVPTRNVGIVTSFNKPTGEVTGPGLKWVAPWKSIDDWDASRNSFDHRGKSCVTVRITGLQNACVEVLIEWTTDQRRAPEQWASYKRDFNNFVAKRVEPNLVGAVNDAFADHDPLANVDGKTGQVLAPDTKPFVAEVKSNVEARIGADVDVHTVVIGFIRYDAETQKSIEAFQQKVLANKNLLQDEKNADVQKRITEKNAQVDPVTRCLEIVAQRGGEPGLCLGGGQPVQVTNR